MTQIQEIAYGGVFTHLTELLVRAAAVVRQGGAKEVHAIFQADPVYPSLSAGAWVSPVPDCPAAKALGAAIADFRTAAGSGLAKLCRFPDSCEQAVNSYRAEWCAGSYLIVPVVDGVRRPGLVYLQAQTILEDPNRIQRRLAIGDLTQDPRLLPYFDSLAVVLMKRFFFVSRYPFDAYAPLSGAAYRLLFGCQITEGKSVGAAALSLFAITFLRNWLREATFSQLTNPQPALVSGEVDPDGNIGPVDCAVEKVAYAIEEYGPSLKVVVPADNPLGSLERRIDKGNLYYVSNVDELLTAVLNSGGEGFSRCREAVFRGLGHEQKGELRQHLSVGVPAHIYEMPASRTEAVARPGNLYSMCLAWKNRLDVSVAPDRLSASRVVDRGDRKMLVQVVLDGSHQMDVHWSDDEKLGASRVATAVFQIKRCIDFKDEELVVGLLSTSRFVPIKKESNAREIQKLLDDVRDAEGVRRRGAFLRPLREASLDRYGGRSKRILLVTDGDVPDAGDVPDERVALEERLGFMGEGDTYLFKPNGAMNQRAFDLRFKRTSVVIPKISVNTGVVAPLAALPPGGWITRRGDSYAVSWENPQATHWDIRLVLAETAPHQVVVEAEVERSSISETVSFPALATRLPLSDVEGECLEGELEGASAALWNSITSGRCPCGIKQHVHLYHRQPGTVWARPIFDIPQATKLFLLLEKDSSRWTAFRLGCKREALFLAVIDGKLRYWGARGHEQDVPHDSQEPELYRLEHKGKTFFIAQP